ncbi:hypothetical protein HELRODRAFT_169884 [Helobdella robusta]|uniref:PRA1 family protein n=1 Tax=Helobdella robusta TaxID=6412 RepID=T1F2E5_HELRO|nr:hypothetical protein HELRODRAFT_169884 [Helobdella robusta]ESO08146.1 hypothetical protein HELRODRAFT_169884 [Helobdella robusta]
MAKSNLTPDENVNLINEENESTTEIDLSGNIEEDPVKKIVHYSLGQRIKTLNFPGGIQVKEWFLKQKDGLKPWADFANTQKFSKPKTVAEGGQRLIRNVSRFKSNYLYVSLGLLAFTLLTSPFLLLTLGACLGACYMVKVKNANRKIIVMGKELSMTQQYAAVGMISLPILWLAGAGTVVFWVIGVSMVVIILHAVFHSVSTDDDDNDQLFDIQMNTV